MLKQSINCSFTVMMKSISFFLLVLLFLSACTQPVQQDSAPAKVPVDISSIVDAVPRYEKRTRAGNPKQYEVFGKTYRVLPDSDGYQETGIASWYGSKFHGKKTSNGETYDMYAMTAAHKTLPIPSYVRVTHLNNQRSVVLRVNDRGPFHGNRIIDLSYAAAVKLGIQQVGTAVVKVTALPLTNKLENKSVVVQANGSSQEQKYYLQVGAFVNVDNAQNLQQRLLSSAVSRARIQQVESMVRSVYKVQVGPLYSSQQAQLTNDKLVQRGFNETHLVVEK